MNTHDLALPQKLAADRIVQQCAVVADPNASLIQLWCARLLWLGINSFTCTVPPRFSCFDLVDALAAVGIQAARADRDRLDAPAARERLLPRLRELEAMQPALRGTLGANIELLGSALDLAASEQSLLGFLLLSERSSALRECLEAIPDHIDGDSLIDELAAVLAIPAGEISAAIHPRSPLFETGLLHTEAGGVSFYQRLKPLQGLSAVVSAPAESIGDLMSLVMARSPKAKLALQCFPHLGRHTGLVARLLGTADCEGDGGFNVLLHGEPGVGKTEYVRALAAANGFDLYEIPYERSDRSAAMSADERLSLLMLAQALLERTRSVAIVLDEAEDLLWQPMLFSATNEAPKIKVNRALERRAVPTFWICNDVLDVKPWQLRRFDLVTRVPAPPRDTRRHIARKAMRPAGVSDTLIDELAQYSEISPALIEHAGRVACRTGNGTATEADKAVRLTLNGHLEASRAPFRLGMHLPTLPLNLRHYNTDVDLAAVLDGIARQGQARLCVHGPPGTGKTSLARLIAERSDRPLITRRASDLLSMWVGETEKRIRRAFQLAADEGAVLLIDEIDGFLGDRRQANARWEVTQVNEMLVAMEQFDGIFVAATNRFEALDPAALRRFDEKVELKWLRQDQVSVLVNSLCAAEGCTMSDEAHATLRLDGLRTVSPGDVHAVVRRLRLRGMFLCDALVCGLAEEQRAKGPSGSSVGFLATLGSR